MLIKYNIESVSPIGGGECLSKVPFQFIKITIKYIDMDLGRDEKTVW